MKLEDMLAYKVAMLSANVSKSLSAVYVSHGLTMEQWRVMATLGSLFNSVRKNSEDTVNSMTAKQLVNATQLDKVKITRALQQMEHTGLIKKVPCARDGRAVSVSLSVKGQQTYDKIIPAVTRWQKEKLSNITDFEYETFQKVIDKLMA